MPIRNSLTYLDELIRPLHQQGLNDGSIAERLGVNRRAVNARRRAMGLAVNYENYKWRVKPIEGHDDLIRQLHGEGKLDRDIAATIGCSRRALSLRRTELGLKPHDSDPCVKLIPFDDQIRARLAEGWSDAEIGKELGFCRRVISYRRKALGLPASGNNERRRAKVREKTRQQLAARGLTSPAQLRIEAFKKFAREKGWPEDLPPRAVQILELLHAQGVATFEHIAKSIGMNTTRKRAAWLYCNRPGGSYTAVLMRAGLVMRSPKILLAGTTPGKRKCVGRGVHFYGLTPLAQQMKEEFHARTQSAGCDTQHTLTRGDARVPLHRQDTIAADVRV